MTHPLFPRRRADGTFTVAVRYAITSAESTSNMQSTLDRWLRSKVDEHGLNISSEMSGTPQLSMVDADAVQVVFECVADAVLWKGLLVELTTELDQVPGTTRTGFWDLVAGQAHPASL